MHKADKKAFLVHEKSPRSFMKQSHACVSIFLGCSHMYLVVRRAADGVGAFTADLLGESEISQLEVPILVHQEVLWLQVTVDNATLMQVIQSQ